MPSEAVALALARHAREQEEERRRARAGFRRAVLDIRRAVTDLSVLVGELHSICRELLRRHTSRATTFPQTLRYRREHILLRETMEEEGALFTRWLLTAEECWREIDTTILRVRESVARLARTPEGTTPDAELAAIARLDDIPSPGPTHRVPGVDPLRRGAWHRWLSPHPSSPREARGTPAPPRGGSRGSWWDGPGSPALSRNDDSSGERGG